MFIGATALTVFWMLSKYKTSYDLDNDKFHGVNLQLLRVWGVGVLV